jgi:hypothetical protein
MAWAGGDTGEGTNLNRTSMCHFHDCYCDARSNISVVLAAKCGQPGLQGHDPREWHGLIPSNWCRNLLAHA